MARPIVLSNGEMHVGLNSYGVVHDFYYPYVGLENHSAGKDLRHKIGVWVDNQISWTDDGSWVVTFEYPHDTLIGHTVAINNRLGVILEFDDCVSSELPVFVRSIHIINNTNVEREIRLFMHQAFAIGDSRSNTDTAQYLPDNSAILHYRGRRAFVISGSLERMPFDQHSIGLFGIEGRMGTWHDANDGELAGGNVEHGRVDSVIRFRTSIEPHGSKRVSYWIASGTSLRQALYVHKITEQQGLDSIFEQTSHWWQKWLEPSYEASTKLPDEFKNSFIKNCMILKSQIDKRGAVIASTDSSMLNYSRDAYTYCWPRDGASVIWPLIRMGYKDEPYRFFEFCKNGMNPSGYLMHKYRSDGALGSSWHPYIQDDIVAPPIQEDETAIVVYMFSEYYKKNPSQSLLTDFYKEMIKPMADFMMSYIDKRTGLPQPSYNLWEETFITSTYTVALVKAALISASDIAHEAKDDKSAIAWQMASDSIANASKKYLYNAERGAFNRGIIVKGKTIYQDPVIDTASVFGAFLYGLFDESSSELRTSVDTVKSVFNFNDSLPGLPRYEHDQYRLDNKELLGNIWFICSLWLAQYSISIEDNETALKILRFVRDNSLSTGMIAEQYNPITNRLVSPAPLTWSHAEYLITLLDLAKIR